MSMRGGLSFENALREGANTHFLWKKWVNQSENSELESTNDQENEIISVLKLARRHPSLSFKIFGAFRRSLRMKISLRQKQETLTLQAKAQAVVSATLFVLLFVAQWLLQPDFPVFLATASGKLTLLICISLVAGGLGWVFRLARPREIEL